MKELNAKELDSVTGAGVPVLLAALGFVWHEMDNIEDFVEGVFHGLED